MGQQSIGGKMANLEKAPVTLEELLVSSLAQTDALSKLLIDKGIITQQEFLQKIAEERATYQRMLNPTESDECYFPSQSRCRGREGAGRPPLPRGLCVSRLPRLIDPDLQNPKSCTVIQGPSNVLQVISQ